MSRRHPHGARMLAALVALLIALVAAGCGGSDSASSPSSSGPDPATVAPADAAVYGQAIVRPSGDMKAGVVAAARKVLLVDDPGAELTRLLDETATGDTNFSRDVEPWLGQTVGGFLLMPSGRSTDPDWAVAIAIADRDAFDDALPRLRRGQHEAGTYRGVAYDRDDTDDTYGAPVEDFYVAGTLAGLRAAIDASKGSSLDPFEAS